MLERVILLSGAISCGKSTLAAGLAQRFGMSIFKTREVLERGVGSQATAARRSLQAAGDQLDRSTRGSWVIEEVITWSLKNPSITSAVVDAVRIKEQIEAVRKAFGPMVTHVHLTAPLTVLEARYEPRDERRSQGGTYGEARENATERQVDSLREFADIVIDTNRCTKDDVLVRAASHLRLYSSRGGGYVDVLVGGQYGSEGKGQIIAYLAPEYDLLVRVGGPNAGHTVYEEPEPYTHHQLPSGTRKSEARLLIGPGAVLEVQKLLKEIAECNVDGSRCCIDDNAMIICQQDCESEQDLVRGIGSTGQGVGAATARRITERHKNPRLARDIPELKPYLGNAFEVLQDAFSHNGRVLLEGTQGTGLSLYHGEYPYVTSRDTTVAGCLAEAGIAPNRVRRIIMVCRTYPIRVQSPPRSTSGPMSHQLSWAEISKRSGICVAKSRRDEKTSTTNRRRRVGEFDWTLLRKSAFLNGPTDIALTFTDYLSKTNQRAMRFEQLTPDTINFVQEVERVAGAPVTLLGTGFSSRSIIDRRAW